MTSSKHSIESIHHIRELSLEGNPYGLTFTMYLAYTFVLLDLREILYSLLHPHWPPVPRWVGTS